MLANMNDVLKPAQKGKYAVGLFNAVNLELARGIIAAAEKTQSLICRYMQPCFSGFL